MRSPEGESTIPDPTTRLNAARYSILRGLRSISWVTMATLAAASVGAQEPPLRPVSDLLAGTDSVATKPYIARRCSGLFSLTSDRYERLRDQDTADMYTRWSIGFEVVAIQAEIELGGTADEAVGNNTASIAQITDRLRERMNRIRIRGNDPLLSSDLRRCRALVDELGVEGD
jgi:hypothetical protein